jgi:hypothetical protein
VPRHLAASARFGLSFIIGRRKRRIEQAVEAGKTIKYAKKGPDSETRACTEAII